MRLISTDRLDTPMASAHARLSSPFAAPASDTGGFNAMSMNLKCRSLHHATSPDFRAARSPVSLHLIAQSLPLSRRIVHEGDSLYLQGDRFTLCFIVNAGIIKLVNRSCDGRERITGFRFKGDWLGMDGLVTGQHECEAVALETGEVWSCAYGPLLDACRREPLLLESLLLSISRESTQAREQMMTLCSLGTSARVAQFLVGWMQSMQVRGLRTEEFVLRLSREELGHHLGMTLESVSRGLNLLARSKLIKFVGKRRRAFCIPDMEALREFILASDDLNRKRKRAGPQA